VQEEEEEEGLFKASAVNEEDPERDRATQVMYMCTYISTHLGDVAAADVGEGGVLVDNVR